MTTRCVLQALQVGVMLRQLVLRPIQLPHSPRMILRPSRAFLLGDINATLLLVRPRRRGAIEIVKPLVGLRQRTKQAQALRLGSIEGRSLWGPAGGWRGQHSRAPGCLRLLWDDLKRD